MIHCFICVTRIKFNIFQQLKFNFKSANKNALLSKAVWFYLNVNKPHPLTGV